MSKAKRVPPTPANKPMDVPTLLAVPTRGHVWYETAVALAPYNPQYVRNKLSVADVRNRIVRDFLKVKQAQALVMCDDDVIPPPNFLDILINCPYDIAAAAVPVAKMPAHEVFINAFTEEAGGFKTIQLTETGHLPCDAVGTGLILIHRRVLEHPDMKQPFNQLLDEDGCIQVGQDLEFCHRARKAGFTIGISMDALCDHYVSLHANAISMAYKGLVPSEE